MDAKIDYSNIVSVKKEQTKSDEYLAKKISSGERRKESYSDNWESVDINEVVERLVPNYEAYTENGKMIYHSDNSRYEVVADIGGGYLRIRDALTGDYLGANGDNMHNYTDSGGKQHGRSKSDYNRLTHFVIKKRKG